MTILGKYNQAKTVYFDLFQIDGIDIEIAATFATGDLKIMKDEGAEANTTNLPTDEGTGYSLVLTAAEMSAARIKIYIIDQTGTKVWLDTSIYLETYGNTSAEHAFDLDTASTAQTADHTVGIADIPTVSEFNARTLVAADYFDPANDAVANVTLVATTTTNTDMRGTDGANTTAPDNTSIAAILVDTGTTLPATLTLIKAVTDLLPDSGALTTLINHLTDIKGGTFSGVTDSLEAIRDRGDAAWVTGAGGSSPTVEQIRAEIDSNSTQLAAILLDTGTSIPVLINNLNNLSAAQVNAEADTALADFFISAAQLVVDFWSDTLTTYTDGMAGKRLKSITAVPVLEGTVNDASATATVFKTTLTGYGDGFFDDTLIVLEIAPDQWQGRPVSSYVSATGEFTLDEALISAPANGIKIAVQATHIHPVTEIRQEIDANSTQLTLIAGHTGTAIPAQITALNDPTAAAVAAAVAAYDMGNGRTIEEALAFLRNKWTIIGGVLTVYDTDDVTVLWTSAMTQTAGDPVSASDPA